MPAGYRGIAGGGRRAHQERPLRNSAATMRERGAVLLTVRAAAAQVVAFLGPSYSRISSRLARSAWSRSELRSSSSASSSQTGWCSRTRRSDSIETCAVSAVASTWAPGLAYLVPLTPKTEERQAEELRLAGRGLQPVMAGSADLVRMAGATAGTATTDWVSFGGWPNSKRSRLAEARPG